MAWKKSASIILTISALSGVALSQPAQKISGPIAVYWMSAQTSTGFGAMMGGGPPGRGGGRPDIAAMMGGGGGAQHQLTLQLGSSTRPTSEPTADHIPAAGLATVNLPLVSPKSAPAPPSGPSEPTVPREMQRPNGRMLIFWGCGEHAPAGQPVVLDFAQLSANPQTAAAVLGRGLTITAMQPPSPSRNATYGDWPNEKSRVTISPDASLVGPHAVKGDYSPDINFVLGPQQDFLGALNLTTNAKTPVGAAQVGWTLVPNALGYFAMAIGGGGGGRGDAGNQVVIWTSSAQQVSSFVLPDYLPPAEVARLVTSRVMMGPETTSCTVPKEVVDAAPQAILQLAAYGNEANFSYPPRPANRATPWNIQWEVKVRYRSSTGGLLGMAMPDMGGVGRGRGGPPPRGGQPDAQQPPPPTPGRRPSATDILRGLGLPSIPGR